MQCVVSAACSRSLSDWSALQNSLLCVLDWHPTYLKSIPMVCSWPQGNAAATAAQMKQQIHQLAAAAAAAASAYPAALAQLAAASSGAFSSDFAAASALAAVTLLICPGGTIASCVAYSAPTIGYSERRVHHHLS